MNEALDLKQNMIWQIYEHFEQSAPLQMFFFYLFHGIFRGYFSILALKSTGAHLNDLPNQ